MVAFTGERFEEGDEAIELRVFQVERLDIGIQVGIGVAAPVVVLDDSAERGDGAVVHEGRMEADITEGGSLNPNRK